MSSVTFPLIDILVLIRSPLVWKQVELNKASCHYRHQMSELPQLIRKGLFDTKINLFSTLRAKRVTLKSVLSFLVFFGNSLSTEMIYCLVGNTLCFTVVISKGQTHQLPHGMSSSPQQRTNDVSLFSTANWKKKVRYHIENTREDWVPYTLLMDYYFYLLACHMVFFVTFYL